MARVRGPVSMGCAYEPARSIVSRLQEPRDEDQPEDGVDEFSDWCLRDALQRRS